MVDFSTILAGFGDAFTLWNLSFVLFGVVVGQFVGAVPGIGPVMAMAIAVVVRCYSWVIYFRLLNLSNVFLI